MLSQNRDRLHTHAKKIKKINKIKKKEYSIYSRTHPTYPTTSVFINSQPVSKLNVGVHDTSMLHKGAYVEFLPLMLYVTVIARPSGDKDAS